MTEGLPQAFVCLLACLISVLYSRSTNGDLYKVLPEDCLGNSEIHVKTPGSCRCFGAKNIPVVINFYGLEN